MLGTELPSVKSNLAPPGADFKCAGFPNNLMRLESYDDLGDAIR